jgi:methyl-accepting chemotaxis protein
MPIIEQTEVRLNANKQILADFLKHREACLDENSKRFADVADLVERLDKIVQSIRHVAKQTNMLALNATIEAARAGRAGQGFAVVASEVKALSRQTDQAAKDISDGLHTLKTAIAESVDSIVVRQSREVHEDLDTLSTALDKQGHNIESLVQLQRDVMVMVQRESENTEQLVLELIGSIQFQDITRQRLTGVTGVLHRIVDHAASLTSVIGSDDPGAENIEHVLSRIEAQRQETVRTSEISHVDTTESRMIELY